jgi:hypothetical protein
MREVTTRDTRKASMLPIMSRSEWIFFHHKMLCRVFRSRVKTSEQMIEINSKCQVLNLNILRRILIANVSPLYRKPDDY